MPPPKTIEYDDDDAFYDADDVFYDDEPEGVPPGSPPLNLQLPSIGNTHMQYWEVTLDRAQKTLPVWEQYIETVRVAGYLPADLATFIDGFEPLAQAVTVAQDVFDDAVRDAATALAKMKLLGVRVPAIISAQIGGDATIAGALTAAFRIVPNSVSAIRERARKVHAAWVKADAALAAMTPANPPITRPIQGVPQTAAMLDAMELGYGGLVRIVEAKEELLNVAKKALKEHEAKVDALNKNFYKLVKNTYEPGSAVYEALDGIPTEGGTAAPEPIEIQELVQGGDAGLNVITTFVPNGGAHATLMEIESMVVGVDADFGHAAAIVPSGNVLGPYTVGQVVKVRTKVTNSAGVRTSAVRTITIQAPLG